jgi:soluble lytic murein transglycosylase-like protein
MIKNSIPRTSSLRIISLLFITSLAFSFGIYVESTIAPTSAAPMRSSVNKKATAPSDASSGMENLDRIIATAGERYGVDPQLIHAVIWKESNYQQHARSSRGAQGLMQLTASTALRFGCRNASDPAANVEAGTRYLRKLLERFDGNVRLALAGYNAGEGSVDKYDGIPPFPETQNFVRQIVARYGKTFHPVA